MTKLILQRCTLLALGLMLCLSLACATQKPALAYADPGTSLMLFQSLSAAVSGLLFYFRRRLKALFSRTAPIPAPMHRSEDRD